MRQLLPNRAEVDVESAYLDLARRRVEGRPYVALNMVASADGAIAVDGRTAAMSSAGDRQVFHYLRSLADVILVGAQTVRAERYGPPKLSAERQAERVARGQAPLPRIAIVSGSLDLDWSTPIFHEPASRPFLIVPGSSDPGRRAAAAEVAEVIVVGEQRADMVAALQALHAQGAGVVLCEGGPTLNGELALAGCIDEVCLTVAPVLVGGSSRTGILGATVLPEVQPLEVALLLEEEGNLFFRYQQRGEVAAAPAADEVASASAADPRPIELADVVRHLDYPMHVVTAAADGERSGCLVGFAAQCSIEPPRFAVWLSKKNHTFRVANKAQHLGVHFPGPDDHALAELFGGETGDEVDKFARVAWREGPEGVPVLDDLPTWFVGRVSERFDSGDHVCFMLVPVAASVGGSGRQLGFQAVRDIDAGHEA